VFCPNKEWIMTKQLRIGRYAMSSLGLGLALAAAAPGASSTETPSREQTIALWHLDSDAPTADDSGQGHILKVRSPQTQFIADGRKSGALQIGNGKADKAQGVTTPDADTLTPKGAFTIEMWIQPDASLAQRKVAYLLDKKYVNTPGRANAHNDYMLLLSQASPGKFVVEANLGFGLDTATGRSTPVELKAGKWHHLAFTYDGQGNAALYLDDIEIGKAQWKGRGSVSNGKQPLVIGDRVASSYQSFPGRIDEVQLTSMVVPFAAKAILDSTDSRTAFYRMEKDAKLKLQVLNKTGKLLQGATVRVTADGLNTQSAPVPQLAVDAGAVVEVPLNVNLRPGRYTLSTTVFDAGQKAIGAVLPLEVTVVARPLPNRMPVVMWGTAKDPQDLKDIGFTHHLVRLHDDEWVWDKGSGQGALPPDEIPAMRRHLDKLTSLGLGGIASLLPGRYATLNKLEYTRIDRQGKPYARPNVDASDKRIQSFGYDVGAAVSKTFGDMPALQAARINSELRDKNQLDFHPHNVAAYRAHSGQDVPALAVNTHGVAYQTLKNFPAKRVVADKDPLLRFYTWFWKGGDGWPGLNTQTVKGLKSAGRNDLWTFFDPAVRAPSLYGSGGGVDVISHWTYTYPEPLKIAFAGDALTAMAAGAEQPQDVMNMTQIIWYRTQTAPVPAEGQAPLPNRAAWENEQPDAKFITIAPDHLSEALWLKLARPVKGIMYHGWPSLTGASHTSYRLTNPQTRVRLTELLHTVVEPLGPTLMQVPDAPTDIAFLASFTSEMFASRGSYGWGKGWAIQAYMMAQHAALQPKIIYDETVVAKGLDEYKVLFMPHCDVLTQSVVDVIRKFQQRGGIIIGDEFLTPAIQPDILLSSYEREGPADTSKATLLQKTAALRAELDPIYQRLVDSSNPNVLVHKRRAGASDYIFVANDNRTFGDYIGAHKMVMEKGLPSSGTLTLNRSTGVVYDLMKHRLVPTRKVGDKLSFDVEVGPSSGTIFLVLNAAPASLQINTPDTGQRGKNVRCVISLRDAAGKPIDAVVPMKVSIFDPQGRLAEQSGPYGAAEGTLDLPLDIATNDAVGQWRIEVEDGVSGLKALRTFKVS
jgi:hypothetical protein